MKNLKNRKGFTMVEAIVVAVIVAILAAVAIPFYINYINNTRQETVDNLAQTAAAAANDYFRKTGSSPTDPVNDLNLFYDKAKYTVAIGGTDISVTMIKYPGFTKTVTYK
jgi:prepilin-type N-terminal cleavage/methylation domain-containing protein